VDEIKAINQLKAGDITGLRTLVELYQVEAVQAACLITGDLAEAEDIVQTAFLSVYEKIQGFDEVRPFRPWFLRMVVNDALKEAARQSCRVSLEDDEDATYPAVLQRLEMTTREAEDAAQRDELVAEMRQALERLSPAQRAAVTLYYFLGLSTTEAASQLNAAPGTVRWHLSIARERLRALLAAFK